MSDLAEALRIATRNNLDPQPQDEHGFLFSNVGGQLKFNPWEAVKNVMSHQGAPGSASTGDGQIIRDAADVGGWIGMSGLGLNAVGGVPANALGSAGAKAPQTLAEALRTATPTRIENPIRAYHGSPHDFDKFDLSKIGTGEGAQAFGHGLYFAEAEPVARQYRDKLSKADVVSDYSAAKPDSPEAIVNARLANAREGAAALNTNGASYDVDAYAISRTRADIEQGLQAAVERGDFSTYQALNDQRLTLDRIVESGVAFKPTGKMYEVAIHAPRDKFLDWDKPLSQQSEAVRKALGVPSADKIPEAEALAAQIDRLNRLIDGGGPQADAAINKKNSLVQRYLEIDPHEAAWWKVDTKDAAARPESAAKLREAGIPGIRYLDQGSRGAGEGTSNFVVFDPSLIEILRKYGLLGPVALGAMAAQNQGDGQ